MNDGIYYVYIKAIIIHETNEIYFNVIDTLETGKKEFFYEMDQNLKLANEGNEEYKVVNLFCMLGVPSVVQKVKNKMYVDIKKAVDDMIHGKKLNLEKDSKKILEEFSNRFIKYILENNLCPNCYEHDNDAFVCNCFYGTKEYVYKTPHNIIGVLELWLKKFQPLLAGKQMINQPFLFKDFVGRKALKLISSVEDDCYYLIFEGNRKIRLDYDNVGTLNRNDLNQFVVNNIQNSLYNPIYHFAYTFEPYEIFLEWFDVFLYGMSVLNIDLADRKKLKKVYEQFSDFIEKKVCDRIAAVSPIFSDKNQFYDILAIHINTIRKCLIANDEEHIVLKNIIIRMRSRWIYLEDIFNLLEKIYPDEVANRFSHTEFDKNQWCKLLENLKLDTNYEKGKAMEELAAYFIGTICDIKITGKNIRYSTEEIDLCCANISNDSLFWNMGALILVECKNHEKKISVSTIRSLSQIMEYKSISTMILFTRSDITSASKKEIEKQKEYGKHFVCINFSDLLTVNESNTPKELLMKKILEKFREQS